MSVLELSDVLLCVMIEKTQDVCFYFIISAI